MADHRLAISATWVMPACVMATTVSSSGLPASRVWFHISGNRHHRHNLGHSYRASHWRLVRLRRGGHWHSEQEKERNQQNFQSGGFH